MKKVTELVVLSPKKINLLKNNYYYITKNQQEIQEGGEVYQND